MKLREVNALSRSRMCHRLQAINIEIFFKLAHPKVRSSLYLPIAPRVQCQRSLPALNLTSTISANI